MATHKSPLVFPALQLGTLSEYNNQPFLLVGDNLFTHRVIYGLTGMGKSKFIATLFVQLFNAGVACSLIDPHSELCDDILSLLIRSGYFRDERAFSKLWYIRFQAANHRFVPFNWLLQPFDSDQIALKFVEVIKRAFPELEQGAANLQNILLSGVSVLIANQRPLSDLIPLLTNAAYRERLLATGRVHNPLVRSFFADRFAHYDKGLLESSLRRLFLLNFSPVLRHSLGAPDNLIDFTRIIDEGISVLFDLGGLDEQTQRLLGVLLTVGYEQAMLSRARPGASKKKHALFIDEWHQFLSNNSKSLTNMLELTRKFGMSLTLSAQHFGLTKQISSSLQNCVLMAFRLGYEDAKAAAPNFIPVRPYPARTSLFENVLSGLFGSTQELDASAQTGRFWELRLKDLPKQHLLAHLDGYSVELQTITVPPMVDKATLGRVKEAYASRLLRPMSEEEAPGDDAWMGRGQNQQKATPPHRRQGKTPPPTSRSVDDVADDESDYQYWTEF